MEQIKNIIFDVGDVLLSYRWKYMLMDYGLTETEAVRIGTEMFDDPEGLWGLLDLGTVPQQEIIERYCRKYPADEKVIRWFIGHGEYMPVARPAVWELVHKLKIQGYGIYLLSNYSEELFKKHTEYADFMNDIDGLIVSYMVHKAKPDPAIYAALCEKYELNPSECLFFDDRLENVQAAISYGMQAKQVLSKEGLAEDLEEIVRYCSEVNL